MTTETTMRLNDSQLVVLSAACARADRSAYPITAKATGAARQKLLGGLVRRGLLEEHPARLEDEVYRTARDGRRYTLKATDAAEAALGLGEAPAAAEPARTAAAARKPKAAEKRRSAPVKAAAAGKGRKAPAAAAGDKKPSKKEQLVAMLQRKDGVSLSEAMAEFGWLAHTTRAAIAVQAKAAGLTVTSEKEGDRGRVYRAEKAAEAK